MSPPYSYYPMTAMCSPPTVIDTMRDMMITVDQHLVAVKYLHRIRREPIVPRVRMVSAVKITARF